MVPEYTCFHHSTRNVFRNLDRCQQKNQILFFGSGTFNTEFYSIPFNGQFRIASIVCFISRGDLFRSDSSGGNEGLSKVIVCIVLVKLYTYVHSKSIG